MPFITRNDTSTPINDEILNHLKSTICGPQTSLQSKGDLGLICRFCTDTRRQTEGQTKRHTDIGRTRQHPNNIRSIISLGTANRPTTVR